MRRRLLFGLLFWSLLLAAFVGLASAVGLTASGYQVDWSNLSLKRTGLLYLAGAPRSVTITINDEVVGNRLPVRFPTLAVGNYEVVLTREGYLPWRKSFRIFPGEAVVETDIVLYLSVPEVSAVTDPQIITQVRENTAPSPLLVGTEIRYNNNLITRFSGTVKAAVLSPDRAHVFYQYGREIRVIETDGSNDTLLFTLSADNNSNLLTAEAGKNLLLLDDKTVKRLKIR